MKIVGESSLHNKTKDEKIKILIKLREKKDLDEKIRQERLKKEEEERLEEYYIKLKNMEILEKEKAHENAQLNQTKLRRSFFTTDLVENLKI